MTVGKEWKVILLFTLPIIAGNALQQMYNIIDGIIVGNFVGEAAFAAVGTTQPIIFLHLSFAIGLSVGVGIVISQYFGAGKHDELPTAIDTALILCGIAGVMFSVIAYSIAPFMLRTILIVPEEIFPMAITYFRIFSLGFGFLFVYNGVAAILRSVGDSKATLYFLLIATVLSTILTFLFVVVLQWGVMGAAFTTVIAQAVCVVISYIYMRKRFPFVKSAKHWDREIAATMIRLGLPIAVQMGVVAIGNTVMHRLVNGFEHTVPGIIAAFAAAMRLDMLLFAPIMGFQAGLASFVGQNVGADRFDRVKRGFHATLIMSVALTVVMSALFFIFARPLLLFFGLEGGMDTGVEIVRFFAMWFWLFVVYMAVNGVLQGTGDTVIQSVATLGSIIMRVGLAYTAVHFGLLGYTAAWITAPISWGFATIIVYIRYFTGGWKKKAVVKNPRAHGAPN